MFLWNCSLKCLDIAFLWTTNAERHPRQHCPDPYCQHSESERISGWLEDVKSKEYLDGWRTSKEYDSWSSIFQIQFRQIHCLPKLHPQSTELPCCPPQPQCCGEGCQSERKKLNAPRLTGLINPGLLTSTTRKRVCIRPPESSLASNCAVPLFLT